MIDFENLEIRIFKKWDSLDGIKVSHWQDLEKQDNKRYSHILKDFIDSINTRSIETFEDLLRYDKEHGTSYVRPYLIFTKYFNPNLIPINWENKITHHYY